eukprot:3548309-Rhodomonas_salina.3
MIQPSKAHFKPALPVVLHLSIPVGNSHHLGKRERMRISVEDHRGGRVQARESLDDPLLRVWRPNSPSGSPSPSRRTLCDIPRSLLCRCDVQMPRWSARYLP